MEQPSRYGWKRSQKDLNWNKEEVNSSEATPSAGVTVNFVEEQTQSQKKTFLLGSLHPNLTDVMPSFASQMQHLCTAPSSWQWESPSQEHHLSLSSLICH